MRRVAITGVAGTVGQMVMHELRQAHPAVKIMGFDTISIPAGLETPDIFHKRDARSKGLGVQFVEFQPDTVIHLALTTNDGPSQSTEINVEGAANLFVALRNLPIPPKRLLVLSSACVGCPQASESKEITPNDTAIGFDKDIQEIEKRVQELAQMRKQIHVSWIRPGIVMGGYGTEIVQGWVGANGSKGGLMVGSADPSFHVTHTTDLVKAIITILEHDGEGAYNVVPQEPIKMSEANQLLGIKRIYCPFWLVYVLFILACLLRYTTLSPSALNLFKDGCLVKSKRLAAELDFRNKYNSSREAIVDYVQQNQEPKTSAAKESLTQSK